MDIDSGYTCEICDRNYRLKINYERHFPYCEFVHKSKMEQNNDMDITNDPIPSLSELYKLVQDMAIRIDVLEKENSKLKQIHNKQKIDILEWLNSPSQLLIKPEITFPMWINQFISNRLSECLKTVFENGLLPAVTETFKNAILLYDENKLPVFVCDIKPTNIYIYKEVTEDDGSKNRKWIYINNTDFEAYLSYLKDMIIVEFNKYWNDNYKDKTDKDDKFKDLYVDNYKMILCGDRLSDDSRNQRLRQNIMKQVFRKLT